MSRRRSTRLGSILNLADPGQVTGKSWFTISDVVTPDDAPTTTDVYIYDEIGGWGVYAAELVRELMSVTSDKVRVRINSPGGDVFEGLAIYNALRILPAEVETYVEGVAASAASFIALAGETRTFAKYATGMVHNPSAGMWGESKDLRKMADLLDKIANQLASMYAEHAPQGGDIDGWLATMAEETWFNAQEAVEFGLATQIDESNDTKPKNEWDLGRVYNYAGRDQAPAPRRRGVMNTATAPVPPAPEETSPPLAPVAPVTVIPDSAADALSSQDVVPPQEQPVSFQFDPDVFKVAVKIAADPPVPTDQAAFEWDPEVFRAIMRDKTLTAPAVVSNPQPEPPAAFDQLFDPDLFRQAVIEGVSK